MPLFPQLHIDFPTCHKCKITKKVPSLGGVSKTKNRKTVGRNQFQISNNMKNVKQNSNIKTLSSKENQRLTHQSDLIDFRSKSLLQKLLKIHLLLSVNESLHPPGALICIDFLFNVIKSFRGHKSFLDVMCLSTRYPFSFLRRVANVLL